MALTRNKPISEWQRIALDTSVICALFTATNPDTRDEDILFTRKLIDYLGSSTTGDRQPRTFYISSIVLSELLTRENDTDKIKKVLRVLNSANVEFMEFDTAIALRFNQLLYPHLSRTALHARAAALGFQTHEYMMAREWITRDYMIIVSGMENSVDITLAADLRTFYPLTQDTGIACALTYRQLWDQSDQFIMAYHYDQAQAFIDAR